MDRTIGITAFVCSTTWSEEKRRMQRLLKFGVFAFTLATYLYMGPYRKVPANGEEKIMSNVFAVLSAMMALDLSSQLIGPPRKGSWARPVYNYITSDDE